MDAEYFMDFGDRNSNCHTMSEGIVLWKITGHENRRAPIVLRGKDTPMVVQLLMIEGNMKASYGGRQYPITKDCFADFIDCQAIEIGEISDDALAYVLIFSSSYITALLKNTPPYPPSYVMKVRAWPVYIMPPATARLIRKRIESIDEILADTSHHFRSEIIKCALWMFMLDVANDYILNENKGEEHADTGRKNAIYKQFIRLLFTHLREEHSVGWYATQLCVTPQYLNRVVRSISQKTVYDHICTALMGAITEQLENPALSIAQIAEEFHFPDQATLTKFFKRHTAMTPSEYRKTTTRL